MAEKPCPPDFRNKEIMRIADEKREETIEYKNRLKYDEELKKWKLELSKREFHNLNYEDDAPRQTEKQRKKIPRAQISRANMSIKNIRSRIVRRFIFIPPSQQFGHRRPC